MWEDVGIVRDGGGWRGRRRCSRRGTLLDASLLPTETSQELADLVLCSRLVTEAALRREESRGAHYRTDFPEAREEWRRHIVFRQGA